jgi:sporulation protein YlmC with PRC-barrel domain
MFARTVMAALASTALLASAASAQTPTATTDRGGSASGSMSESSLHGDWRASKIVGLSVYNDQNEKLGSINDLLMDKAGNVKAVVLGVGGFLSMGSHLVAVPLDKIKFVNEPIVYTGTAGNGAPGAPGAGSAMNRPLPPPTTTGSAAPKPNPWYPDHAVFDATKDSLKAMPEFKYSS